MTDKSIAQRSQTTGHLVLKLPKANYQPTQKVVKAKNIEGQNKTKEKSAVFLEIERKDDMDFSKIIENNNKVKKLYKNAEVPHLEYF